jgi:hypothetical protein
LPLAKVAGTRINSDLLPLLRPRGCWKGERRQITIPSIFKVPLFVSLKNAILKPQIAGANLELP